MNLLDESIAAAAAVVILLQLYKLKLAKRLEHILQVCLCDAEMNVAYIEAVEGDRIRVVARGFRSANLAILLSLGQLDDDGNT